MDVVADPAGLQLELMTGTSSAKRKGFPSMTDHDAALLFSNSTASFVCNSSVLGMR